MTVQNISIGILAIPFCLESLQFLLPQCCLKYFIAKVSAYLHSFCLIYILPYYTDGHVFKNPDMKCGQIEHVTLCIWSAFTFFILILCICFRANSHDIMQHEVKLPTKLREDIHNFDAYYSCFRLLAMITIIIVAESSAIISSLCLFFVFMIPNVFTIKKLPYVRMIFNYIRCSMDSFNVWSSFALFVVSVVDDRQSYAGFIVWCCFPFFIIFCCLLCKVQLKNRPLSKQDLRTGAEGTDGRMAYQHVQTDFDEYLKDNHELSELLSERDKCIMMRPCDTNTFLESMQSQKSKDFYCIIGCNQAGNRREEETTKKWNDEQVNTFCEIIKECDKLVVFRLNGWIFEQEQLYKIVSTLLSTPRKELRILDLGRNCLGVDNAKNILDIIEKSIKNHEACPSLKEINFVGNYINYKIWREEIIDVHTLGDMLVI